MILTFNVIVLFYSTLLCSVLFFVACYDSFPFYLVLSLICSGIGKSMFRCYILYRLAKLHIIEKKSSIDIIMSEEDEDKKVDHRHFIYTPANPHAAEEEKEDIR